ncbi:MAG: hypothetical protein JW966_15910 [Anaerolineae bacterium]|nr:hypothetical protein [Anaerolineae bacterium]
MPKLVILITPQTEKGLDVAEAWELVGATGISLIESYGLHNLRERSKAVELPFFVSLASAMRQIEETNQIIFTVADDAFVDRLIEAATQILGDLNAPHTGIAFTLDVDRIFGIPCGPPNTD